MPRQEFPAETTWSRPVAAIRHIFSAAELAMAHLDHLPEDVRLPESSRDGALRNTELRHFIGSVSTANERRYHASGVIINRSGLSVAPALKDVFHETYENGIMPFSSMMMIADVQNGQTLLADGLNIYGNPENPSEITANFARIRHGDTFLPLAIGRYDTRELQSIHERFIDVLNYEGETD